MKQTILIADDVELNRSLLADMLGGKYHVLEAANGLEAVSLLKQYDTQIALVLLDVVMPELDGFDVLAIMNKKRWIDDIPVIMISAETSMDYIEHGYELGAVEYISRPYNEIQVRKRVENTIALYAKQKKLQSLLMEQIAEKEQGNTLMVDILSTIVEFRNGESGLHVQRIRMLTEILLTELAHNMRASWLRASEISIIANAAALHDVGKIAIPEEILNKPGKLTPAEFEIMKTHSTHGFDMLKNIHTNKPERLLEYALDICRWHHERWDGRGYPDGLAGDEIPIWAQVVSLADVYDALVSPRVYKPAFPHDKAVAMIMGGECGAFSPQLLSCLSDVQSTLEERIRLVSDGQQGLFNVEKLSWEAMLSNSTPLSDRTLFLLEQERMKYQFFSDLSNEILFDYDAAADIVTVSDRGLSELGLRQLHRPSDDTEPSPLSQADADALRRLVRHTSAGAPVVKADYLLTLPSGAQNWYHFTIRTIWTEETPPHMTGCLGKLLNIHEKKLAESRLASMAQHDSITGLYNHPAARIEVGLRLEADAEGCLIFVDLDDFGQINNTHGHVFGDHILKQVGQCLRACMRPEDISARMGGDEFLAYLPGSVSRERIDLLLRHLRQACPELPLSISAGVARYPADGASFDALLDAADAALTQSKQGGKNTYTYYDPATMGTAFVPSPHA